MSIEVVRHGDRWSVVESGSTTSEHATQEAAVLEARRLAGETDITVREDDPTGLDAVQADDAGERADGPSGESGIDPEEFARRPAGGL